jgi:predicted permease
VSAAEVTPGFFEVIGRHPALGRSFHADEGLPGVGRVVVLTDRFWKRRFDGDPAAVGRSVLVDGVPFEVVGVMPPDVELPLEIGSASRMDLILPLSLDPGAPRTKRGGHYLQAVGRLKDGVSMASASAEMDGIIGTLIGEYPEEHNQGGFGIVLRPLEEDLLGSSRPVLLVLAGAVGLVLLLACANVASLLLARGESRRLELALRAALGATRVRIARQLLTEASVLSFAGAATGLVAAWWTVRAVAAVGASSLPRLDAVGLSAPVLLFAFALALSTGIAFGLVPALQVMSAAGTLKQGSRGGSEGGRARVRRFLAVGQIGIAVVLLVGAGLLMKSFLRLVEVPSGLEPDRVLTLRLSLPNARYPTRGEIASFFSRYLDAVRRLPGVRMAGASSGLPLSLASGDWGFDIEGRPRVNGRKPGAADWYVVTPGYFEALGIRLVRGRLPFESDAESAPAVIFINETTERALFPDEDAIGRRVRLSQSTGAEQPWRTIAGVVSDVRTRALESPPSTEMFIPYRQFVHFSAGVEARSMTVVLKTSGEPSALAGAARFALQAIDPEIPAADVRDMNAVLTTSVADRRMHVLLVGTFALLALVIASIGVYGVIAYHVAQRRREIGLRLAVGASRASVLSLVVRQGLRLVGAGILLGLVAALFVSGLLATLLYEVAPRDALVFASVAAALLLVGAAASYLPARRVMRVDPVATLRAD